MAPRVEARPPLSPHHHDLQLYEGTEFLLDTVADGLAAGLALGQAAVVIATAPHREGIERSLERHGVDVTVTSAEGRYLSLDAAHTLSLFMKDDAPDPELFASVVGGIIERAAIASHGEVQAFGEMVALLWERGQRAAAIEVEDLWNELAQHLRFTLRCGYPLAAFAGDRADAAFAEVTARHGRVFPTERYLSLGPDEQLHEVARLQQQAAVASRATAAGDAFFARVTHEMRTPLSAILGFTGLLESRATTLGAREVGHLGRIRAAGEDLRRLLEGILELADLDTGRTSITPHDLEIGGVLAPVVDAASDLCVTAGIAFEAGAFPAARVRVDARRLSSGLIEIARHLARSGEPAGALRLEARVAGEQLRISLVRSGTAISPRRIERLFEAFPPQYSGGSKEAQPTRVGLAYARRVVELHGGSVTAGIDPESATAIRIVLPLSEPLTR